MVWLVCTFLSIAPGANFEAAEKRCEHWLSSGQKISVEVDSMVKRGGKVVSASQVSMALDRGSLKVRWVTPGDATRGTSDWLYTGTASLLKGYDLVRGERLESKGGIAQLIPNLPEQAQMLLVRNAFKKFGTPFVKLSGWKPVAGGGWRRKVKGSVTEFAFDPKTGGLTKFYLKGLQSTISWTYKYQPFQAGVPALASTWPLVPAFLVPSAYPVYKSAPATGLASKVIQAYDTLRDLHVQVSRDGNVIAEIWRTSGVISQRNAQGYWRFTRGLLEAVIGNHRFRGGIRRDDVAARLDLVGIDIEPLAQALITRENFGSRIFTDSVEAKPVGQLGSGQDRLDLLELDSRQTRTLVAVDGHGWIRQLRTTTVSEDGKILSKSERDYENLPPASVPAISPAGGWKKFPPEPVRKHIPTA